MGTREVQRGFAPARAGPMHHSSNLSILAALVGCRAALSWFGYFTLDLYEWQEVATRYRRRQEARDNWGRWLLW
jgi:hypothetical protein